jgi:FeS assembly SUF system regulator
MERPLMIRLSRLTDYGIVLMANLAQSEANSGPHNAREAAAEAGLPAPVVSKLLKTLARAGLLTSHRGSKGGYSLARPAADITVPEMIEVLEGPIRLTECAQHPGGCAQEASCHVREPWQHINAAIYDALAHITLADLAAPALERVISLTSLGVDPRGIDSSAS